MRLNLPDPGAFNRERTSAVEKDTTTNALAIEAFNDLFEEYGMRRSVDNPLLQSWKAFVKTHPVSQRGRGRAPKAVGLCICIYWALIPSKSTAQWWNPFAPADFEECSESAAKTANTDAALKVLLSVCSSKFMGRRKAGGGYTYFDPRQLRTFDIAASNPTPDEIQRIDTEYLAYLGERRKEEIIAATMERRKQDEQAEAERAFQQQQAAIEAKKLVYQAELLRRRQSARAKIRITTNNLNCLFPALEECDIFNLTLGVQNLSRETISSVLLGWTFIPANSLSCPSSLPSKQLEAVRLAPGDTTVLNIKRQDGPASKKMLICVNVADVEIAP